MNKDKEQHVYNQKQTTKSQTTHTQTTTNTHNS